ncbi:uncharacterized protein LOC121855736 isoform X2 [Homarus americanus]|uniref:uncharacterized protein LOC121855736 isoform X2 n=1 Tax=Homarus americanus TaxID=6706 RepID=UPI001C44D4DD|nr:uncharacterized protein LOC121855736 isoform X2 [Homarus americanus]
MRQKLQPLDNMEETMEGDGVRSPWTEHGQRIMSAVLDKYSEYLTVTDTIFETLLKFSSSKPHVVLEQKMANTTTSTHIYPNPNRLSVGSEPITSKEMGTKFKSREAIMELLIPLGVEFGDEVSCRDINQAAFDLALSTASGLSKSRFETRGRSSTFHPDEVKLTGSGWLEAHLLYSITDAGLEVKSPSLPTDVNVGFGLGGMHYCKLLTPTRALEYLIIDSLVGTQP